MRQRLRTTACDTIVGVWCLYMFVLGYEVAKKHTTKKSVMRKAVENASKLK